MRGCDHEGCGWRSIAPTEAAGREQHARHLVEVHGETVDADLPDGTVAIRTDEDEPWQRVTLDEAMRRHRAHHEDRR